MTPETRRAMATSMSSLMCKDREKWVTRDLGYTVRYHPVTDLAPQVLKDEEFIEWFRNHVEWTETWLEGAKGILQSVEEAK